MKVFNGLIYYLDRDINLFRSDQLCNLICYLFYGERLINLSYKILSMQLPLLFQLHTLMK